MSESTSSLRNRESPCFCSYGPRTVIDHDACAVLAGLGCTPRTVGADDGEPRGGPDDRKGIAARIGGDDMEGLQTIVTDYEDAGTLGCGEANVEVGILAFAHGSEEGATCAHHSLVGGAEQG